jgi:hypothetical protein
MSGWRFAPPFTDRRTLAIFDPMQLRRLAPGFRSALAEAADQRPATLTSDTVTEVVAWLQATPWGPPPGWTDVTPEQADAEVRRRHREFLGRQPFIRPAENNIPSDGE